MEQLSNLPKPVIAGVAIGGGGLMGAGMAIGSGKWWVFLIVFAAVIVLVLIGFLLVMAWRQRRKSAQMGGQIQQHNSLVRGISDPGQRARLDDLRKKFEQGVNEYRSRGKDLYTLPWYMIVGEPGSGKTEAVRRSNVGFPPGMQDEFQGVGGTINMNWWFTNYAVLLDTAGRLMFDEIKPGETSEWKEFLSLLKNNRPNCPVNGLLLVIPSDSLIKDTGEEIARKAGRIAQQLDVIQRVLDVRFPVFVIVSKCDKINGFREFFDGLKDPQQQHQIMGWSNPGPLDQPFQADSVAQHLARVVQRLNRRRLGLLRDPIAEAPNGRRLDEVDALYALPHSLSLLAPRLRRYLETIFVAGEWSAKPLFLRGIYFTSSMREGSALDEDLANVMGVPVDQLGEGKVWERERAYFLRDLMIEKVFRERGLVTRATNTTQLLRRRKIMLIGGGSAALLIFILVAILSMMNLRSNVEEHSRYWSAVSSVGWQNGHWKQPIVPVTSSGVFAPSLTNQVVVERPIEVATFHASLRDLAEKELPRNWFYPGLSSLYSSKSRKAQRVVFETGVLHPLVEGVRQKIPRAVPGDPAGLRRFQEALVALIRLEADASPGMAASKKPLTLQTADAFMRPLWSFLSGQDAAQDPAFTNLVSTFVRTCSGNDEAASLWAPTWLSGAISQPNLLGNNPSMRANLDALETVLVASVKGRADRWTATLKLREALIEFKRAEESMYAAAKSGDQLRFEKEWAALIQAKSLADGELQQPRVKEMVLATGTLSLTNAFQLFAGDLEASALETLKALRVPLSQSTNQLYLEIGQRLAAMQQRVHENVASLIPAGTQDRLMELEKSLLARPAGYSERMGLYQDIIKQWGAAPFASRKHVAGLKPSPLEKYQNETIEPLRARVKAYPGSFKAEFEVISLHALVRAEAVQRLGFLTSYSKEMEEMVKAKAGFPLVKGASTIITQNDLANLKRDLNYILNDLKSPELQGAPFQESPAWKKFAGWVGQLSQVAQALLDDEGAPLKGAVYLRKKESDGPGDDWSNTYHDIQLGAAKDRFRSDTGQETHLGSLSLDESVVLHLFKNVADSKGQLYPATPSPWIMVRLLQRFGKSNPAGTLWQIDVPLELPEGFKNPLRLKLELSKGLPVTERWPEATP